MGQAFRNRQQCHHIGLLPGALFPWRDAEMHAVALGEMRSGNKAAHRAYFQDGHGRLLQQLARPDQPQLEVIARRRTLEVLVEQALQLTA
ncbi:hypothetical protein D3C76_717830 [compost metagenome]